jgi:hypothetical protein
LGAFQMLKPRSGDPLRADTREEMHTRFKHTQTACCKPLEKVWHLLQECSKLNAVPCFTEVDEAERRSSNP